LCLDKGYDYPEIERESIKRRYVPDIRHRGVEKELIKIGYATNRWVVQRTNGCTKNKLLTQDSESY